MRKERSITIRMEGELLEALEKAAEKEGRSVGSCIRLAAKAVYLPEQEAPACPSSM